MTNVVPVIVSKSALIPADAVKKNFLDMCIVYKEGNRLITERDIRERFFSTYELDIHAYGNLNADYTESTLPNLLKSLGQKVEKGAGNVYVLTNKSNIYGAASMLCENRLHKLAEKLNDNLYIIPSSVHEVLVVRESDVDDTNAIKKTIHDINNSIVKETERLSYSLYLYEKDTGDYREV